MPNCFLGLGSNMGDRMGYLTRAIEKINKTCGPVLAFSAIYETASWGIEDQSPYLNQVLLVNTNLLPAELLEVCKNIEIDEGRVRIVKWGSRTIDIDILFYENRIVNDIDLVIPHPHLQHRNFVLVPMAEIAPDFMHPVLNKSIHALLSEVEDTLSVTKISLK